MFSKQQMKDGSNDKTKLKAILTCSKCGKIVEQPKTLHCYHSFCQTCVDRLPRSTDDGATGMSCSICNVFSNDSKVQSDLLINEFLEMFQFYEKGEVDTCQTCKEKKSAWNCMDCMMLMCDDCQKVHSGVPLLKNHSIRALTSDKHIMVIDRLVFCKTHDAEPVKLYCVDCAVPLCMECKVTEHENHKTESIQKATEKVIPVLNTQVAKIKEKCVELDKMKAKVHQQIADTKQAYINSGLEVDEKLKQLTTNAKAHHKAVSEELVKKEEEQVAMLVRAETNIDCKLKEYHSICDWAAITTTTARGTILLVEIKNGLLERAEDLAAKRYKISSVIDHPYLEANEEQEKMNKMVGSLRYSKLVAVSTNTFNGKHTSLDFCSLVGKAFTVVHNISLPSACARLSMINDEIWIPLPSSSSIQVYSTEGVLLRSIEQPDKQPRALGQLTSGEIVLASNVGLFILDDKEVATIEIAKGQMTDLDIVDDIVNALNYTTKEFIKYCRCENEWKPVETYTIRHSFDPDASVITTEKHMFVGSSTHNVVKRYNINGQFLSDLGYGEDNKNSNAIPGNMLAPTYVCAIDEGGSMLVADYGNARLQLLVSDYVWNVLAYEGAPAGLGHPYDCKLDNNGRLWITNSSNKLICLA